MLRMHTEKAQIFFIFIQDTLTFTEKKKNHTKAMKTEKLQVDTHALSLSHVSPSHPQISLQYMEDTL